MKKMLVLQLLVISINVYADNKYKEPSYDSLERLMTENYINNGCRYVGDEAANLKDGIISDLVKSANLNPIGGTIKAGLNTCEHTSGFKVARMGILISIGDVVEKECQEVNTGEYICAVKYKMYCKGNAEYGKITPMTMLCTNINFHGYISAGVLLVRYSAERRLYELVKVLKD